MTQRHESWLSYPPWRRWSCVVCALQMLQRRVCIADAATCYNVLVLQRVAVYCNALHYVVLCCSLLQCAAVCCSQLQWVEMSCGRLQWVAHFSVE